MGGGIWLAVSLIIESRVAERNFRAKADSRDTAIRSRDLRILGEVGPGMFLRPVGREVCVIVTGASIIGVQFAQFAQKSDGWLLKRTEGETQFTFKQFRTIRPREGRTLQNGALHALIISFHAT